MALASYHSSFHPPNVVAYEPVSHVVPVYSGLQLQLNPLDVPEQTPPFRQVTDEQGTTSDKTILATYYRRLSTMGNVRFNAKQFMQLMNAVMKFDLLACTD